MTAYLSKIAARVGNTITENYSSAQPLLPSRATFDSKNIVDSGFSPAPFANEFTFMDSIYPSGEESLTNDGGILKPTPNFISAAPLETVRTLFYSGGVTDAVGQSPFEDSDLIVPPKTSRRQSNSQAQQASGDNGLKPNGKEGAEGNVDANSLETNYSNLQKGDKGQDSYSLEFVQKNEEKQIISPSRKNKMEQFLSEKNMTSNERKLAHQQVNNSFAVIGKNERGKGQRVLNQLKPTFKKQEQTRIVAGKKSKENKIRIGSIRVEIVQGKSKQVKARSQQLPRQKVAAPPKPPLSQSRFPLRFGLKQL